MASSTTYDFNTSFAAPNPAGTPRGASTFDPVRDSVSQLAANGLGAMAGLSSMAAAPATQTLVNNDNGSAQAWQATPQPQAMGLSAAQLQQGQALSAEEAETRRQVVQFCCSLSTVYRFSDTRRGELLKFAGTLLGSVPPGDIMARAMERCTQYQILDKLDVQAEKLDAQALQYGLLIAAIDELRGRLQSTFSLTADQMKNIRVLCTQMLVQPERVVYMELADAVFIEMQKPDVLASLGMTGVLATASQRQHVMSYVRRTCSSVRNNLREDTREGVGLGSKKNIRALAAFSIFIARKYRSGESETNLVADTRAKFTIKLALLRAFAVDNAQLLSSAEDEDAAEQAPEPEHQVAAGRRRKTSVGRVKKGEDFWSKVEVHFAMLAQVHGAFDFSSGSWDTYITSVLEKDKTRIPPAPNAPAPAAIPAGAASGTGAAAGIAATPPAVPQTAPAGPSETPLNDLWTMVGYH